MKKSILSSLFLSLVLLFCGVFYGCGGRYDSLSMQASFSYAGESAIHLDNDVVRVQTSSGVFDDNQDGTYTFYIDQSSSSRATSSASLQVNFDGVPDDFNYNASINFTNNIGKITGKRRYTSKGFIQDVTFYSQGKTVLEILSAEGNKKVSLNIDVVKIAKNVNFKTQNYALTKTNNSYIDLDRTKALNVDGSIVNISYKFGYFDNTKQEKPFVAFTQTELWGYGLDFDQFSNKIFVTDKDRLIIEDFVIEATYENPLKIEGTESLAGEPQEHSDIIAYTSVSIVNEIPSDSFEIYLGSDYTHTQSADAQRITSSDLQNLIVNIANLNYIDIVLKARTDGEEVEFGFNSYANLPVDVLMDDEIETTSVTNPLTNKTEIYSYKHFKIIANKRTTEDSRYPNNGEYNLELTCYYKNYTVEGYPIVSALTLRNDTLVKNFSINSELAENTSIDAEGFESKAKKVNVYINTDSSLNGTKININVAEPVSILSENANFTLKLYKYNSATNKIDTIPDASSYFKIKKAVGESTNITSISGTLSEVFNKNTTFYFRAEEGSDLKIGDKFYLAVEAELPAQEELKELKAKAVVEINIQQGIEYINLFDYYFRNYVKDEEGNLAEVEGAIYDKLKGRYYKLKDTNLADTQQNRIYLETNYVLKNGEHVVPTDALYDQTNQRYYALIDPTAEDIEANRNYFEDYEFDESFYSNSQIKIDLTSIFDANVSLKYLPFGADISNLTIETSKPSIFTIGTYIDEYGDENTSENYFSIIPHNVGEGEVLIKASNLTQVYKIGVKVYKPITDFSVKLSSTLRSSGIGDYVNDTDQNNTLSAIVQVNKAIDLNINTLPVNASEYTLRYKVYALGDNKYSSASDLLNITDEGILLKTFEIDYEGKYIAQDDSPLIEKNGDFQFDCASNRFIFLGNQSRSTVYRVEISLINFDDTRFEKSLVVASYVPVEAVDISLTSSILINPNTLYYEAKTQDINDPSVFGLNVAVNEGLPAEATFDFRKSGLIEVIYNGELETYEVKDGFIVENKQNQILIPVSAGPDDGYFWFRVNENKSYSSSNGVILVNVVIKEFNFTHSSYTNIYVQNAERVTSILTNFEEMIYFKHSITPAKTASITATNEKAYNKELLIKVLDVIEFGDETYYVETTNVDSVLKAISIEDKINFSRLNKTTVSLTLDANDAGNSVVVVMPQDRVVSKANYDAWNKKQYVSVDLTEDTYRVNFYYIFDEGNYVLATEEFDQTETYFIGHLDVFKFAPIWNNFLVLNATVADGVTVPYQVSNIKELKEISISRDTVTKRYVLTNNITLDASDNWQPIGNYYAIDFSEKDQNGNPKYVYSEKVFYTYNEVTGEYSLDELGYDDSTIYYLYGFNGELNGCYKFKDIKTGVESSKYFTISNVSYAGKYNRSSYGLISNIGYNGRVDNLSVKYNYFQPVLPEDALSEEFSLFNFGGIAGINNGQINNCQAYFNNVAFDTQYNINFGGIAGNNLGVIDNSNALNIPAFSGIKGEVKLSLQSTSDIDSDALVANIGGLVGVNSGVTVGMFNISGDIEPTFNDSGFDASLNISVFKHSSSKDKFSTSIGGAVGLNKGAVKNICVQGNLNCENFDNVGGLVGKTNASQLFYEVELSNATYESGKYYVYSDGAYTICLETNFDESKTYFLSYNDIESSYSIAKVVGRDNVGGAIGFIDGLELDRTEIYNISAENYSSLYSNQKRTLVIGRNNVGGLVGKSLYANINYSYAVSYYDNFDLTNADKLYQNVTNTNNYDVVASGTNVGGFIGNGKNTSLTNSASSLYVLGVQTTGIFVAFNDSATVTAQNIFATGLVYSKSDDYSSDLVTNLNVGIVSNFGYYTFVSFATNTATEVKSYIGYYNTTDLVDNIANGQDITTYFNGAVSIDKSVWAVNHKVNAGLPYLLFDSNPLFATTPFEVNAVVKDTNNYISYIKHDNNSLILFYNYDYLNFYQDYIDLISALNMFGLSDLVDIAVYPKTHKSYKLDVTTSNSKVISIDANGNLKIVGVGNVIITISSKLNSNYKAEINIVVDYGLSDIKLYSDVSLTQKLIKNENNGTIEHLDILKNRNHALYLEQEYVRDLGEIPSQIKVSMQYNSEVGVRFAIPHFYDQDNKPTNLETLLNSVENANTLDDLFKFNGISWLHGKINYYNGTEWVEIDTYYVDVPVGTQPIINPYIAFEGSVEIFYTPFIRATFGATPSQIMLEPYSNTFNFSIKKGATKFVLENNLDNIIAISQLQTQVFTLTLYTDFEEEVLQEDFNEIYYESYTDNNLWDVINNNQVTGEEVENYLSIVRSDVTYKHKGSVLESISITYTVTYKDKVNAVEKDRIFKFYFGARSNPNISQTIGLVILGQDKINQVYGTIYSNLSDFPQTPEKNNIIYNGSVGTLSLEVYPFFSNYSKMRVYYTTDVTYPLFMTQLSYDIKGESGKKLDAYPGSGSVNDSNQYLWIEKSSGQDTYLFNDTGTYSYSRTYFISLLVSTELPDNTDYTIYVDFLSRNNDIIETYQITITTIAQPGIKFGFDEKLKGSDNQYYLPLNTVNKLNVNLNNYEGEVEWEVTSPTFDIARSQIEEVLTPYKGEDGNYYLKVMEYSSENNSFTSKLLGHTLKIKGSIEDGRNAPKFAQNYYEIDVVVTLFTVMDVSVKDCVNGYLTATVSSTTPLYVNVDAYYDSALTSGEDNWYTYIMSQVDDNPDSEKGALIANIKACGYEVEDSFINYITQLQNSISKAKYNSLQNESPVKTSGIWYYNSNEPSTNSGYIQSSKEYNSSTFGVELSNGYFAVYGHQIDINTSLSLKLNLAYNNGKDSLPLVKGIPNVLHHNLSSTNTAYQPVFNFNKDFILSFVYKSDLINAIPVSTEEEFLNMEAGFDYRLVNDIELSYYTPISTAIATLDGNNHTIFITSFGYGADYSEDASLGLFDIIDKSTILYNVKVCYTNKVERKNRELVSVENGLLNVNLRDSENVAFGGIAVTNNGSLTNCTVEGAITITINEDVNYGPIGTGLNGGLVATNTQTGYITNSKIKNFDLSCYGVTGGVVATNEGKIVSTYLTTSSINNLSSSNTGGFVNTNNGEIYECFVEGYRLTTDADIRNTGDGITSKGVIGGFVYSNANIISDCYSNIALSSSLYIAGFVYTDTQQSNISRCYSISYKSKTHNPTIAAPFAGTSDEAYRVITINGQLNNCYYLAGTDSGYRDELVWANDAENKKAVGLTLDEFATHTKFTNYDLSLVYETAEYADGTPYYFVDGYTWVIVEGKPVIVSTQIDTISQRDYEGKSKIYSSNFYIFKDGENLKYVTTSVGAGKEKTFYYTDIDNPETLVYTKIIDTNKNLITYNFSPAVINESGEKSEELIITYNGSDLINKTLENCEYGNEDKKILDVREKVVTSKDYFTDSNFRANDTLEILYNDSGEIVSLKYYVLESASYYYRESADGISHAVGSRTNPQIIYDAESFSFYLSKGTLCNFYRVIKDIDFNYGFTKTSYSNFQGALQGNYMNLDKISISYQKDAAGELEVESGLDAFGLFAKISTIEAQNFTGFKTTNISNLRLNIVEVLSNTHKYVGALAGQIVANNNGNNKIRVVLNNVSVAGYNGNRAFIQGKNAVGGLVGYVTGAVVIKDISTSVCVNATKEMNSGSDASTLLYMEGNKENNSEVSYAGGVVGIFDANKNEDPSTGKNFNANNISISGEVSVVGGIVGSAFGLVGINAAVNYVNTIVNSSDKNYLKAIVYAGGLVGENRGQIISSSISYGSAENYSSVKPGESSFISSNYFYNGSIKETVVAIGGLVGFNNGGEVLQSVSSINVRNTNATIAGGAIGRMVTGKLENVSSYGSVKAKTIIGGFIGTLNQYDIISQNSGYNNSALVSNDYGDDIYVVIKNCVSATNWLVSDYTYYLHLLSSSQTSAVGGFIGLVSRIQDDGNYSNNGLDFISFENSFYTNTIYTSVGSVTPKIYLNATCVSGAYDSVSGSNSASANKVEVLYKKETVGSYTQAVWPYSTREVYYENTSLNASYNVKETLNNNYNGGTLKVQSEHKNALTNSIAIVVVDNEFIEVKKDVVLKTPLRYYYEVSSSTLSESIKALYTYVDFDTAFQGKTEVQKKDIVKSYLSYYGVLYQYKNGKLEKITADNLLSTSTIYYFIDNINLKQAKLTSKYDVSTSDIFCEPIILRNNSNSYNSAVIDPYNNSNTNIILPTSIIINGIEISNIEENGYRLSSDKLSITLSLYTKNLSEKLTLPNGAIISNIALKATWDDDTSQYKIEYVELDTLYNIQEATDNNSFITLSKSKVTNSESSYTLNVSSKKVIFKNYLNNGYWNAGSNFLLNDDYTNAEKYLTNIENAEIYTWEEFKKQDDSEHNKTSGYIYVDNAEELALVAYLVNSGINNYSNVKIILTKDIDLSGKYWVPIGTETNPFKGTFNGQGHSIKYATVNKNSLNDGATKKYVEYAGLFGCVGSGATIQNLITVGGDIEGLYAGGVVAKAQGSVTLQNITNKNVVTAYKMGAGIVAIADSVSIEGCINQAKVTLTTKYDISDDFTNVYAGGLIAKANLNETNASLSGVNYGEIDVENNKTSYAMQNRVVVTVGGIAGYGEIVIGEGTINRGNIKVSTNADRLNVGGIVGFIEVSTNADRLNVGGTVGLNEVEVKNVKNYGNIEITYNNIKSFSKVVEGNKPTVEPLASQTQDSSAYANIGGVVGYTNQKITNCGNEGKIEFNINSSTYAFIAIGGIVGQGVSGVDGTGKTDISSSYSSNNITVSTISARTSIGVGGIIGFANVSENTYIIQDCYNAGNILTDGNSSIFVGGILGSALLVETNNIYYIASTLGEDNISNELKGNDNDCDYVYINKCLSIGYISVTAINSAKNGLGTIAGIDTNLRLNYNYYLKGSAYSGNNLYTSVSYWNTTNGGAFTPLPDKVDDSDIDSDKISNSSSNVGAREFLSTTLKNLSGKNSAGEQVYKSWNFSSVWQQSYITWYPTIQNNSSSALWLDKQEMVYLEKGSYVISSAEELAYLSDKINSGLLDSGNITIKLSKSIDLSNRFWTPIGTKNFPFKGTFDGQGYTINNLTIDGEGVDESYLSEYNYGGLFGYTENAIIKNVGLESPIIQNVKYAGTIAVYANNTRIEKVFTDCEEHEDRLGINVYDEDVSGAGGLVYNLSNCIPSEDSDILAGIYYSYNNIQVKYHNSLSVVIGGLVGKMSNSLISNSYNNSKGRILYVENQTENILNNHIVGQAESEESCILLNVFNLADYYVEPSQPAQVGEKSFYIIERDMTGVYCRKTGVVPLFENLTKDGGVDLDTIWTKEYSLNDEDYTNYPSLRGLGKEWKNTESEALSNYNYITDDNADNASASAVEKTITRDKSLNSDGNVGHIKIVTPQSIYLNQTTDRNVYLIETAEELAWLATNVNNGSLVTYNCQFILLNDINLENRYWTPIGISSVYSFQGIFNFNGHTISNLIIDADNLHYAGLFGYTTNAYITNGYVKNAFIKTSNTDDKTNLFAGTIVGKAYNTSITNIKVTTNVVVHSNSGAFVGGIVGSLTGTNDYQISNVVVEIATDNSKERGIDFSKYSNCVVEHAGEPSRSQITTDTKFGVGAFSQGGNIYAGGVVGYILGYANVGQNKKFTLENATSNINVLAVNLSNASDVFIGGIAGYALEEATINLVESSGFVKAYSTGYDLIGGIVGYMYNSSITNAYFNGYVEGTRNAYLLSYIGGIVGTFETEGRISNVVNNGSIFTVDTSILPEYRSYIVGGIIGRTLDHIFINDGPGLFSFKEAGFEKAVGIVEYLSFAPTESQKDFTVKFSSTDFTPTGDDVGFEYWVGSGIKTTLNLSHTYLIGGGASFTYNSVNLSNSGVLINLNNPSLLIEKIGAHTKMKIAYVNSDCEYQCEIVNITANSYNLSDLKQDRDVLEDLTYIYVTLIEE